MKRKGYFTCLMFSIAFGHITISSIWGAANKLDVRSVNSTIPKWLAESETYGFYVQDINETIGTKWKFITHCPRSEQFLRQARAKGIRAFPYITFYQAYLDKRSWCYTDELPLSEHLDWIVINQKGDWQKTGFWDSEDDKNMYCICFNNKDCVEFLLSKVEENMQRGASGFFLDNVVGADAQCFGPQFGKHEHMFETQKEAFADLLRKAREIVKRYDPEGAVLINSAEPANLPKEYWPHVDCEMSESYICTWVSTKRWGDWHTDWNGIDKKIPESKQVCCLSYPGHTGNPLKDDIYFCYASARLMNFIWNGGRYTNDSNLRDLYSISVGQPTIEETVENGVHFRQFENGIVAVNPTDQSAVFTTRIKIPASDLYDMYRDEYLPTEDRMTLSVPAQSGRVWLYMANPENATPPKNLYVLSIKTEPLLGKTWFEIDGLPYCTHSGRWVIAYEKGAFGNLNAYFDKPGYHTIKIIDEKVKELLVPNSYEDAFSLTGLDMPGGPEAEKRDPSRLGTLMDPANPQKMATGKPYIFTGWSGPVDSSEKEIRIYVDKDVTVIAHYQQSDREE